MIKKHWKLIALWIGALWALVWFLNFKPIPDWLNKPDCPTRFADIHDWTIPNSSIPAQIAWQKHEIGGIDTSLIGPLDSGLTMSSKQIVLWQGINNNCSDTIIGLDADTGNELWKYELKVLTNFNTVTTVSDGYMVILDGTAIKLDTNGQIVWKNSNFPSRSIHLAYEDQNRIYIPSQSKIYILSPQTGIVRTTSSYQSSNRLFRQIRCCL